MALAAALGTLVLAAMTGIGLAAALWGDGWIWPADTIQALAATRGLLTGHPGQGLTAVDAARLPGPAATYATVVTVELVTIAVAAGLAAVIAGLHGPGGVNRGMASRSEAARILGIRRLRSARAVIRPDLYGTSRPEPRQSGERTR